MIVLAVFVAFDVFIATWALCEIAAQLKRIADKLEGKL